MRQSNIAIGAACWIVMVGSATAAAGNDLPVPLKQAGDCMLKISRAEPGVEHARSGVLTDEDTSYIFVEYEPSEKTRWREPTRFVSLGPYNPTHGPYTFQALLPGLVGREGVDLHVTTKLISKWKAQCGVDALMLFN